MGLGPVVDHVAVLEGGALGSNRAERVEGGYGRLPSRATDVEVCKFMSGTVLAMDLRRWGRGLWDDRGEFWGGGGGVGAPTREIASAVAFTSVPAGHGPCVVGRGNNVLVCLHDFRSGRGP